MYPGDEKSALHLAVVTSDDDLERKLPEWGADVSWRNATGNNALHAACLYFTRCVTSLKPDGMPVL